MGFCPGGVFPRRFCPRGFCQRLVARYPGAFPHATEQTAKQQKSDRAVEMGRSQQNSVPG